MTKVQTIVKSVALAGAIASVACAGSSAALAQGFNWTGFYVGLNAGYAWGTADTSSSIAAGTYFATTSVPAVNRVGSGTVDAAGFTGGAQAGYNWQSGNLVLGLETDIQSFKLGGSRSGSGVYPCCAPAVFSVNNSVDTDWLLTFRPRLGMSLGNTLLYVTGGLAVTSLHGSATFSDNCCVGTGARGAASHTGTKAGWTVGGGAEWALNRNWTLKGEYLYVDFGSVTSGGTIAFLAAPANNAPLSNSADLTAHIGRVGVNYKF